MLVGFRGVKRMLYACSPRLWRTPSIQPKHKASSTDSGHVMLGLPEAFLWKPTRSSVFVPWCLSNQARNAAGVAKNFGFMKDHSLASRSATERPAKRPDPSSGRRLAVEVTPDNSQPQQRGRNRYRLAGAAPGTGPLGSAPTSCKKPRRSVISQERTAFPSLSWKIAIPSRWSGIDAHMIGCRRAVQDEVVSLSGPRRMDLRHHSKEARAAGHSRLGSNTR